MPARPTPEAAERTLLELASKTRELQEIEAKRLEAVDSRNMLVYEAIKLGATERRTAQVADVDPSYAHRCSVGKGKPASGHQT